MGVLNLPCESFAHYFVISHGLAQRVFIEATRIVAVVYRLFDMQPSLQPELEKVAEQGIVLATIKLIHATDLGTGAGNGA
jgi:hypothetical protein